MDDDTIFIIAGVGLAAYFLKDSISNLTKPTGDILSTADKYLNIPLNTYEKITDKIEKITDRTNVNTIVENNKNYGSNNAKSKGIDGVGIINNTGNFIGFGAPVSNPTSKQDFNDPKTIANLNKLFPSQTITPQQNAIKIGFNPTYSNSATNILNNILKPKTK